MAKHAQRSSSCRRHCLADSKYVLNGKNVVWSTVLCIMNSFAWLGQLWFVSTSTSSRFLYYSKLVGEAE